MYERIFQQLYIARRAMTHDNVKKAIMKLINDINDSIENSKADYKSIYAFCEDKKFIFRSNKQAIMFECVVVTIKTNGLLAQILDEYGVVECQVISDQISQSLLSIQSKLENKDDIKIEKRGLEEIFETLKLIVA